MCVTYRNKFQTLILPVQHLERFDPFFTGSNHLTDSISSVNHVSPYDKQINIMIYANILLFYFTTRITNTT